MTPNIPDSDLRIESAAAGQPRNHPGERAVVIGAGIGGLLAAGVLANHFVDVVVIERDRLPATPEPRKGVPHGRHVHGLLGRGCRSIEERFPGFRNALIERGANAGDALEGVRWFHGGGYHAQGTAGFEAVVASRALIEGVLRERLLLQTNVRVLAGTAVDGLVWNDAGTRVTGVQISGDATSADGTLPAGLVVDSSGRGSRLPAWLVERGYPAPAQSDVEIGIRYASRTFQRDPAQLGGAIVVSSVASPANPHGSLALAIEGGRWLVSVSGRHGEQPPTSLVGFRAYTTTMANPDIFDLVREAKPLDEGATYAFPRSTRRHYERLDTLPEGIVPLADAVCSFNPIYGQGMTVAALEADILDRCLEAGPDGLARRFLAASAPLVDGAWNLATSADLRFTTPESDLPPAVQQFNRYLDLVHLAAHQDLDVARAFCQVMHLMSPPDLLRSPEIMASVMAMPTHDPARQPIAVA